MMRSRPFFWLPVLLMVVGVAGLAILNEVTLERRQLAAENALLEKLARVSGYGGDEWQMFDTSRREHALDKQKSPRQTEVSRFGRVWLADGDKDGVSFCVLEVITARAYNGEIRLLIGLRRTDEWQHIHGVSVLRHTETPGLGDQVEDATWLRGFVGLSSASPKMSLINKRRGGDFAALTGATVSADAVLMAVRDTLRKVGHDCGGIISEQ